jgi:Tol biopolymer transport system component
MISAEFSKRKLLLLFYLLSLLALTGCTFKSNHFGVIFTKNVDIYRIPDNTQSNVEQLTFTPTIAEYNPLVSKNGDKVIFDTGDIGLTVSPSDLALEKLDHIYILDTATRKLDDITDIFTSPPIVNPPMAIEDWSPDQKQFAFINYQTALGIMNFDGTNRKDISMPSLGKSPNIALVRWSPDGMKLAMNHSVNDTQQLQNPGAQLLVYDLKGDKLTQLADYDEGCVLPKWSPTSQQIVATCSWSFPYMSEVAGSDSLPETVRIFDVDHPGQPYERLTFSPCSDPSWSPNGRQIVFVCDKDKNHKGLFIVNSDGNDIHEINLGNLGCPAILKNTTWSPDGIQIIYVAGTNLEHENIYSINSDGSNNRVLTIQPANYQVISAYPIP